MHSFAHEGSKDPLVHGVDSCLERHAENDEAEVRQDKVQDEKIGGLCVHLPVANENGEHETVSNGAHQKDDGENHRYYYRLNFPVGREINLLRCVHRGYFQTPEMFNKLIQYCVKSIRTHIEELLRRSFTVITTLLCKHKEKKRIACLCGFS